jgi:hypothetical protein
MARPLLPCPLGEDGTGGAVGSNIPFDPTWLGWTHTQARR